MPRKNDPIKRDDIAIERARKRWPNANEDEILALLRQAGNELDEMEEQDRSDGKA